MRLGLGFGGLALLVWGWGDFGDSVLGFRAAPLTKELLQGFHKGYVGISSDVLTTYMELPSKQVSLECTKGFRIYCLGLKDASYPSHGEPSGMKFKNQMETVLIQEG